jgi:hypothetical protein
MVQNRENKLKHLTRHAMTEMSLRACLATNAKRTYAVKISVEWKKEAAP